MAWPGAIAIGISLGLLGSGGSILTVPVLVYLVGQDEKVAIAGSLFIVGSIALAGSLQFIRAGFINWRSVAIFGLPGMAGTYIGAAIAALVSPETTVSITDAAGPLAIPVAGFIYLKTAPLWILWIGVKLRRFKA